MAERLGMTLTRLFAEATREEILGWHVFFQVEADAQRKALRKAK